MTASTSLRRPPLARRSRLIASVLAIVGLALGGMAGGGPAFAAGETLNVTLAQTTGTGPFDADDAAGHDSSASNDIVRTNDTVAYTVGIRYEGGDQSNPTITLPLPQGEKLVSLPPFCLAGSSVTPGTLPDPAVPLTATSWMTLPAQTVVCVVAPQAQGTALDYTFLADVRPEVPNGTQLSQVAAQAVSDQVTTPAVSDPVQHSVSSAPTFDLSKRLDATTDTTGPLFSQYVTCTFDQTKTCLWTEYPLTVSAPAGAKGISPLATPITFTDDLSPDVFYPAGTTSDPDWIAAGAGAAAKYGARIVLCDQGPYNLHGFLPNSSGGSDANVRAVRNSGTITCTQPGGPGTPVLFTITNADTSGVTYPSQNQDGGALSANSALVISTTVLIETPLEAITDLGTRVNDADTLATHNTYSELTATDISGQPDVDDPANNVRDTAQQIQTSDGTLDKAFVGITGHPGNTPPAGFGGVWEGLPGSSFWRDGNTTALTGQTVISVLTNTRYNIPPNSGTSYSHTSVICDVWDSTKLGLPNTFNYAGAATTSMRASSNGSPVWMASEIAGTVTGTDPSAVQNLQYQYSYTPTPGNGTSSSCDTGSWYSSPSQVPGATLVNGVWQGVNQVRASFADRGSDGQVYQFNLAIALQVVSTDATGTILPNWASRLESTGVKTMDEVLADPNVRRQNSNYDPATAGGSLGDRLLLGQANARITKFVKNPTTGQYTDTTAPQYTAGSMVDYRLNPSLTADVSAGTFHDVTVEDCLPVYQAFTSSARESGSPLSPTVVQQGSPAGAGITCAAGETYIRWDLGQQQVNAPIDPIVYTVEVLATVRNGAYTNTTVVSSPADGSPVAARTDTAQVQIVVPTGIKIAKSVDKPLVEVTPAGAPTPRGFTWTIDFANIDAPQNVSNADVIDVLPANGLRGTHFTGTLSLASVTPASATTGVQILYTADPPAQLQVDPSDPSNGAAGSTVWCDAATGGAVVSGAGTAADCPTSIVGVTGLRFLRPGTFVASDQFMINVAMVPSGNAAADVYENRTSGRVIGVSQPVGPAVRTVTVIASSIGDLVWKDLNSNGVQDAGEPGVAGVPVSLSGTDIDGNPVTATTTTDANGNYLFAGLASGTYVVTFDPAWVAAHNFVFTLEAQGTDGQIDSNANVTTGATGDILLGVNEQRLDIDAGLVQLYGGLVIVKHLSGVGVANATGPFDFSVECTYQDQSVYSGPVSLVRSADETTITSDRIGDIPVGASCVVTETGTGGADATPAPVTVLIVTNDDDNTVTAGFVNEFSAGTISVQKDLAGTAGTDPAVTSKTFTIQVTCQIDIDGVTDPVTVYSGDLPIKGGQNLTLVDGNGDPILLPLGTVCFGIETDNGGANQVVVDHDTFGNGVAVTAGTPDALQSLLITATNTFDAVVPTPTPTPSVAPVADSGTSVLGNTGLAIGGTVTLVALLIAGGILLLVVRRRRSSEQ